MTVVLALSSAHKVEQCGRIIKSLHFLQLLMLVTFVVPSLRTKDIGVWTKHHVDHDGPPKC